jgi:hypothetical protein
MDHIRTDLREIGWEILYWIYLAQDGGQWRAEHGNEPSGSVKGEEFLDSMTISFSRTLLHAVVYFVNIHQENAV